MSIDPSDLVRALFDVPAYRGSTTGGERGKWWAARPEEANAYTTPRGGLATEAEGAVVIPGVLNTNGFTRINAGGSLYNEITADKLPNNIVQKLAEMSGLTEAQVRARHWKTDDVAQAVEELGIPGVTFNETRDAMETPTTQHYVADPSRRRSRFAKFQDPNSDDIMAGLVLSLLGGGAATLAQDDET